MQNEYDGGDHQEFKYRLYDIPFRPKIKYQYSRLYDIGLTLMNKKRRIHPVSKDTVSFNVV
jgi:hypothetical protein